MKLFIPILLLLVTISSARAQQDEHNRSMVAPPLAEAREVEVERGGTVRIELLAQFATKTRLKFLLRTQPKHGRLQNFESIGQKTAAVFYQHNGSADDTDSFEYAAQSPSSPVSTSARVNIRITDPPPLLVVPKVIDLGEIWLNELHSVPLELTNRGGAPAIGEVIGSKIIEFDPSSKFILQPGERKTIMLNLQLDAPGQIVTHLKYMGSPKLLTEIRAQLIAPFTAEWQPLTERRQIGENQSLELGITNQTSKSLQVDISDGEAVESATIAPQSKIYVSRSFPPDSIPQLRLSTDIYQFLLQPPTLSAAKETLEPGLTPANSSDASEDTAHTRSTLVSNASESPTIHPAQRATDSGTSVDRSPPEPDLELPPDYSMNQLPEGRLEAWSEVVIIEAGRTRVELEWPEIAGAERYKAQFWGLRSVSKKSVDWDWGTIPDKTIHVTHAEGRTRASINRLTPHRRYQLKISALSGETVVREFEVKEFHTLPAKSRLGVWVAVIVVLALGTFVGRRVLGKKKP